MVARGFTAITTKTAKNNHQAPYITLLEKKISELMAKFKLQSCETQTNSNLGDLKIYIIANFASALPYSSSSIRTTLHFDFVMLTHCRIVAKMFLNVSNQWQNQLQYFITCISPA